MMSSAWLANGTERLSTDGRDSPPVADPIGHAAGTGVGPGGRGHLAMRTVAVTW